LRALAPKLKQRPAQRTDAGRRRARHWFSSALWPFSTLGWPDDTKDLKTFYPTSVLVTARDIIFLWVSRMMMTGLKFMGQEAFADVYVTGTIFDKFGSRMSKTKGNGVDPLAVFDKYGVDATRLTLAQVGSTDTRWNEKQVESYRNFANKIWNAARFCLMNAEGAAQVDDAFAVAERASLPLHDRWILSRLNKTAAAVNQQLDSYDFHAAVQELYHFFWDDFCDWYIELSKSTVTSADASPERDVARARLVAILEQALRLLHPFMPYLTEELWQKLPVSHGTFLNPAYADAEPTIMLTSFPRADASLIDESSETAMQAVIDLISRVRNIRSEMNIKPSDRIDLIIAAKANLKSVFSDSTDQIARLTRAKEISIDGASQMPKAAARAVLVGGAEVAVPLEGLIDFAQERLRLNREKEKLQKEATKLETQLGNADFVQRAPAEKVEELRARVADIAQRNAALDQMLEALS
jgi:valyl-tRNA synthetase